MHLHQKIAVFFAHPLTDSRAERAISTLYLLRREVQDCLIGNLVAEDRVRLVDRSKHRRLFATAMLIATGIDLLAKFHNGDDHPSGTARRIRAFAKRYVFPTAQDADRLADVLYFGLRNPLVHSFTLQNQKFRVGLTNGLPSGAVWRAHRDGDVLGYLIDVVGLYDAFIGAIMAYERDLRNEAVLQERFERMFDAYGTVLMQVVQAEPRQR